MLALCNNNIFLLQRVNIMIFRKFVMFLEIITFSIPIFADNSLPTHEFTLKNGLKVIVREDHRAPVAVSQLWYKVGSSFEAPGNTGLSHALEHMMFKGSSKVGAGEASQILRDLGVEENAFTADDVTVYYQVFAKNRLPVILELEADRMASLQLPNNEFIKEIEVIKEERRLRTDDNPNALAYERFKSLAYPASGYHNPPIGWKFDLDRMSIDDLRAWYKRWYAPNNAVLVIVGDITLTEVKKQVNHWFANISSVPNISMKKPLELAEPGERELKIHVKTQLPTLLMGFNVPSLSTTQRPREVYALELIAALLDGGDSGRITTQLELKQELVSSAGVGYYAVARGDSLFVFNALPNVQKDKSIEDVEKGIWQLIDELKLTPPSKEELKKVRSQLIASLVYSRDSIANQAMAIGMLEAVNLPWQLADKELAELEAVTPKDIQMAAQKYFTPNRLTVAHVLPEEKGHD